MGIGRSGSVFSHPLGRLALGLPALAFAAALACAAPVRAAENLDAYLEGVRAKYGLPALAAAVTRSGEIVASGAAGKRAIGIDIPVTMEDRFHLGSDTKAFTATVAGTLVEEGRIKWSSTLGEVLARHAVNIAAQYYETNADIGYVVLDADASAVDSQAILADIRALEGTIRARLLYEYKA